MFTSDFCRGEMTRTSDLYVPNVARYQLCYTPIFVPQNYKKITNKFNYFKKNTKFVLQQI